MNGISCSVNFLTLKQIGYEESNVAVSFYHDRTHFEQNSKNLYASYAEEFSLQQGRHFVLHNRLATTPAKMSKIKDQVKEFDALFADTSTEHATKNTKQTSNETSSLFLSHLNTSLAKIIWLSSNRLLLIMQDGTLVWLVIDTISGDLIKILLDKTLVTPFGPSHSSNLSGKCVCDVALLCKETKSVSPILILTYSDKSKIDLITFHKASQINEHLKSSKEPYKLEKLSTYEPALTLSYEFACPSIYSIEKRISTMSSKSPNTTFGVWWPNDGQLVWHPTSSTNDNKQPISLLERDDLRNNVLILSTDLADVNLMEYLFKSDGLLLALNYLDENSLISVEQTETNAHKYVITIFRYELPSESEAMEAKKLMKVSLNASGFKSKKSLKIKLSSFSLNAKVASIEQIKFSRK